MVSNINNNLYYSNNINYYYRRRFTTETNITIVINICANNSLSYINSGIPFLDHMIKQLSFHGGFYIYLNCVGDLSVDYHHTIEDIGIVLGMLLSDIFKSIPINRYAFFILPMDESLTRIVLDVSGRVGFFFDVPFFSSSAGGVFVHDIKEFFKSLVSVSNITLHLSSYGSNIHHIIESMFKCFGLVLRKVLRIRNKKLSLSTK